MSIETNKALVRQYVESVWNRRDLEALEALTSSGFTYVLAGKPGIDHAGMQQFLAMIHSAFPDWRVEIEDLVAEGGTVAVRWRGEVTHQGVFHGIAPTGRRITVTGINFYRVEDGKVTAEWEQTDSLGMLQQLGALPSA
jgi:steroid delta-isomerase-like uncharacterized protein